MIMQRLFEAIGAAALLSGLPAAAQEPPSKAEVDCAALQQDLFIDLKVVMKSRMHAVRRADREAPRQIPWGTSSPFRSSTTTSPSTDRVSPPAQTMPQVAAHPDLPLSFGKELESHQSRHHPRLGRVPINKAFGDCIRARPRLDRELCGASPKRWRNPFDRHHRIERHRLLGARPRPRNPNQSFKSTGGAMIWGVGATAMFPNGIGRSARDRQVRPRPLRGRRLPRAQVDRSASSRSNGWVDRRRRQAPRRQTSRTSSTSSSTPRRGARKRSARRHEPQRLHRIGRPLETR